MSETKKDLVYFNLYEVVGDVRQHISTFRKMVHEKLSEKYITYDGMSTNGKNVRVVGMTIPTIKKDNKYPVLKDENPGFIYLYVYFIQSDDFPVTMEKYTFEKQPKHFLTFTNFVQKIKLHTKISELRDMVLIQHNLGIIDYQIPNDSIVTENKVVNPFMSDQGITIFDYIDRQIIQTPPEEEHIIDKILKSDHGLIWMIGLVSDLQSGRKSQKGATFYKNVDNIKDKDLRALVSLYNELIIQH